MTYVVAEPCIGTKDRACVDVCPVACFYEGADQLYIHPEECIDCAACEPVCPVDAIFTEADTPEQWKSYIQKQVDFFAANPGVTPAKGNAEIGAGGMGANAVPWPPEAAAEAGMAAGPAAAAAPKAQPKPAAAPAPPPPAAAPAAAAPAPTVAAAPPVTAAAPAASRVTLPRVAPGEVTGLEGAIVLAVEAAASAAAAAAQAAEAAAAVLRALTGQAVAAPPAAPKTEAKPAEKPDRPKPAPQAQPAAKAAAPAAKPAETAAAPAGPNIFTQGKLVLYTLVDILAGKIPADRAELARAEQVALALQEEIARAVGKSTFDPRELERKDITLRQRLEMSNGIFDAIAKVELREQVKAQQARAKESLPGGLFAFGMAGLSAALGMLYVFKFVFLEPNPTLQDLLQAPFRPEAIMPFVGFNTVALLILPFGLYALWKVRRSYLEAEAMGALMSREFGANSLKAKRRKKLEQLQSPRLSQVQKLLREITAKKK